MLFGTCIVIITFYTYLKLHYHNQHLIKAAEMLYLTEKPEGPMV